jgi:hypothetical protein
LTGIGPALTELKEATAKGLGGNITLSGLAPGPAIHSILVTLDEQLANGLGAAVAIDGAKEATEKAQRKHR